MAKVFALAVELVLQLEISLFLYLREANPIEILRLRQHKFHHFLLCEAIAIGPLCHG